jgi:4-hydroxybenzoate polyprenyltransferase
MTILPLVWWNERAPGGRVKGWVFLVHPGPSLLVTATFVAVAGLAEQSAPSQLRAVQLVGVMLPIQFAIGIVNDLADRDGDVIAKPYKPLIRGVVPAHGAWIAGVAGAALGLACAATINVATFALAVGGLAAGIGYDVGLRRTPLSALPWWAGIVMLPLAAFATVGMLSGRLLELVPLGGLVALGLHLANGAPDVEGDRGARRRSLPVILGADASLRLSAVALLSVAVVGSVLAALAVRGFPVVQATATLLCCSVVYALIVRMRAPFPLYAASSAIYAAAWLATVPIA